MDATGVNFTYAAYATEVCPYTYPLAFNWRNLSGGLDALVPAELNVKYPSRLANVLVKVGVYGGGGLCETKAMRRQVDSAAVFDLITLPAETKVIHLSRLSNGPAHNRDAITVRVAPHVVWMCRKTAQTPFCKTPNARPTHKHTHPTRTTECSNLMHAR